MQLSGKIIANLPVTTGQGKNGNAWVSQDFVLQTFDQYPKNVCFNLWGDKVETTDTTVGREVTVEFSIESREYGGRWYTQCKAWRVSNYISQTDQYVAKNQSYVRYTPDVNYTPDPNITEDDSLPF
jgi:hypothetical protein